MSHFFQSKKNQHPNDKYEDYLYTDRKLSDAALVDTQPEEIENGLRDSIYSMRREFRHTIKRMKKQYADQEPTYQADGMQLPEDIDMTETASSSQDEDINTRLAA